MPIRIVVDKENLFYRPVVICDYCHKEIINVNNGNCLWDTYETNEPVDKEFVFTHKECYAAFARKNKPETSWSAMGLDIFIIRLAGNTHMDWKQATQRAETLSRFY